MEQKSTTDRWKQVQGVLVPELTYPLLDISTVKLGFSTGAVERARSLIIA